jgi:hypothetical protein
MSGAGLAAIPRSPPNGNPFGPLLLHAYGSMCVIAVVAAVTLPLRLPWRRGGSRELVYDVALGFPAGLSADACTWWRRAGARCRRAGGGRSPSGR